MKKFNEQAVGFGFESNLHCLRCANCRKVKKFNEQACLFFTLCELQESEEEVQRTSCGDAEFFVMLIILYVNPI